MTHLCPSSSWTFLIKLDAISVIFDHFAICSKWYWHHIEKCMCRLVIFAQQSLSVEANSTAFVFAHRHCYFYCAMAARSVSSFYHFLSAIVIVSIKFFASCFILRMHIACSSAAAWRQHCVVLNSNSGVFARISVYLFLYFLIIAPNNSPGSLMISIGYRFVRTNKLPQLWECDRAHLAIPTAQFQSRVCVCSITR